MLTSDLVRARYRKGEVRPSYLDPADEEHQALAKRMVELFQEHVGKSRGALEEALAALVGETTDFLIYRGLAKLLEDRSAFVVKAPCDPSELREKVFALSAKHHPVALEEGDRVHGYTRSMLLAEVARELNVAPEEVEKALYADLEREQVLETFEPLGAEQLLHRYNVALAQAVLLRASRLTITIAPGAPAQYRQLFRYVKFYRLLHSVSGTRFTGYEVTLDGPSSIFQSSSKYGVQLAEFLPALLLCEGWKLRAELLWGKDRVPAEFRLESGSGLRSHYPDRGVYVTEEEAHFVQRMGTLKVDWELDKRPELIDLGGRGVLIPDLVLRNKKDGREALLELLGFWRKGSLESRVTLLKAHGPPNLVLAVSRRLKGSDEELSELPGAVVFFKDVLPVKDVLEVAERVATASARGAVAKQEDSVEAKPKKSRKISGKKSNNKSELTEETRKRS